MVRKSVSLQTPYTHNHLIRTASIAVRHASRKAAVVVLGVILMLSSAWQPVQAATAGDLDPAFDVDGKVSTDFFGGADSALDVLIQPDGRIVAAGSATINATNVDFALVRYNQNGSLDTSFGSGGKVTSDFTGVFDQANALALQSDGKIVGAGVTRDEMDRADFALARYNSDGSLDASFGNAGKVVTDLFGGIDSALGVALQPDGRIVVAGATFVGTSSDFALVRYNSDGSLDASFGVGGKVTTDFLGLSDAAAAVRILPDGRIIAAGSASTSISNTDFALVRYNSDGGLDGSFGSGGKVTTDFFGFTDRPTGLIVQPDGRVIAAGSANNLNGTGFDFALARYNVDGSLDSNFGDGGKTTTDFLGILDAAVDIALQSDGRIVAAGFASNDRFGVLVDISLARYDRSGRLDTTFGNGGKIITAFSGDRDGANAVAIQADGQIVVAGSAFNGGILEGSTNSDFALARYAAVTEPDFSLAVDPEPINVSRGQKIRVKVWVNRTHGFAGDVTITAPDAQRLAMVMTPDSALVSGDVIKFKLKIKAATPTGSQQVEFVGRDNLGRERSATLTLDIQ